MGNYDFTSEVETASLAVDIPFTRELNKRCYKMGKELKPFYIFDTKFQEQFKLTKILDTEGLDSPENTLWNEIISHRRQAYKQVGVTISNPSPIIDKSVVLDYLLSTSICYIEIPTVKVTKSGNTNSTFEKFLATKNLKLIQEWTGLPKQEIVSKYGNKVSTTSMGINSPELSEFVKLNHSATKGNTVTCPRTSYDIEKIICTPVYMLNAFMWGMKDYLEKGIVKFSYLKDNKTLRELSTTLNEDILLDYYEEKEYVDKLLNTSTVYDTNIAGMMTSNQIYRGYARLPELGCSIYDESGVRALNLNRIVRVEVIDKVDRTFIKVDLSQVITSFTEHIGVKDVDTLRGIHKALTEKEVPVEWGRTEIIGELIRFVESKNIIMTTTFLRILHLFMIQNPQWFIGYTGLKLEDTTYKSSTDFGVEEDIDIENIILN